MSRNGFTILELVIVVTICGIILALSFMPFSQWNYKSKVETQFRKMYSDLQGIRSEALYRKRSRSVRISSTQFSVYSSQIPTNNSTIAAVKQTNLAVPVSVPANFQIDFDQMGFATFSNSSSSVYVCVQSTPQKSIFNSIILSNTRIQMGSLAGSGCNGANVKPQ